MKSNQNESKIKPKIKLIGDSRPIINDQISQSNQQWNQQVSQGQISEGGKAIILIQNRQNSQVLMTANKGQNQFQHLQQNTSEVQCQQSENKQNLLGEQANQIKFNTQTQVSQIQKIQLLERQVYSVFDKDPYQEFQRNYIVKGHKEAQILEICLNKKFKAPSRFICEFCQKEALHKFDRGIKPQNLMKQLQVSLKIKENYNNLITIYDDYSNKIDQQIEVFKKQIEGLLFQLNTLISQTNFNEIQYRIKQLRELLNEQVKLCEIDENLLYSFIMDQPEKMLYKEFCDIKDNLKKLQSDIDQLNVKSKEIPPLLSKLTQVTEIIQNQELNTDQAINKAKQLIRLSQYEQAIELLIDYLEEDKNKDREGDLRNTLGYAYYKKQQLDQAQTQFEKAMDLCNQNQNFLFQYYIGMCQLKSFYDYKNELSEDQKSSQCVYIIQHFQNTINLNSSFGKAYLQIAKIHQIFNQKEEQQNILQMGIQKDPSNEKLFFALAELSFKGQKFQEAIDYIEQALKIHAFDLNAFYDKNKKLSKPQQIRKFNPIFAKGLILYELGKYHESFSVMILLATFNDPNYKIDLTVAKCYSQLEKYQEALNILLKLQQKVLFDSEIDNQIAKILSNPKYHLQK